MKVVEFVLEFVVWDRDQRRFCTVEDVERGSEVCVGRIPYSAPKDLSPKPRPVYRRSFMHHVRSRACHPGLYSAVSDNGANLVDGR